MFGCFSRTWGIGHMGGNSIIGEGCGMNEGVWGGVGGGVRVWAISFVNTKDTG